MKEDILINYLKKKFKVPKNIIGIGDDTAVLPYNKKNYLLFTTDTILDEVHFKLSKVSPYYIGYKAIAVNISDIAVMGGVPLYAVVNFGIPKYNLELITEIYKGIKVISDKFRIKIVGGDTIKSKILFLAVAMIGKVEKENLILRKGSKIGDPIYVTGNIGGKVISGRHLKFIPRLKEARWIVKNLKPTSMIDISDGLILDLSRICNASGKGAIVLKEKIPISKDAKNFNLAIYEGEDFELLFTINKKNASKIHHLIPNTKTKISLIGEIIKENGIYLKGKDNVKKIKPKGFNHFERWK
jgi:thiamine-monophosphate kinase